MRPASSSTAPSSRRGQRRTRWCDRSGASPTPARCWSQRSAQSSRTGRTSLGSEPPTMRSPSRCRSARRCSPCSRRASRTPMQATRCSTARPRETPWSRTSCWRPPTTSPGSAQPTPPAPCALGSARRPPCRFAPRRKRRRGPRPTASAGAQAPCGPQPCPPWTRP